MSKERSIETLLLDGGCICFDFINTVHSRTEEPRHDYLENYSDLLAWCNRTELMREERLRVLSKFARTHSEEAGGALREIKKDREMLYSVFSAVAEDRVAGEKDLAAFNTLLTETLSKIRFSANDKKLHSGWEKKEINLFEPLWRIGKSAYEILTEQPVARIKECEACGWIFLDQSKNRSRRWCNMQTCGSTHKAKKYYHRKKKGK